MKKCIKNYCNNYTANDIKEINDYLHKYNKCKNLFYNKYYNDIDVLFNSQKWYIRNLIVKQLKNCNGDESFYNLLKTVPAKLWKCALEEAISDMKARWSNIKLRINKDINTNKNLSDNDKHYLRYILKSNNLIVSLLKYKKITIKQFNNDNRLNNYLLRKIKKCNTKKPYSNSKSYTLDSSSQISYVKKHGKLFISIPSLIKRKRIHLPLTSDVTMSGIVTVIIKNNKIAFHKAIDVAPYINESNKVVSLYIDLENFISVSSGNKYGKKLKSKLLKYSKYIYDKNEKRNKLWAIKNKKIIINNLGTKK